jgi:HPt (histidine-containing phosphotransfer) domain-containing protein
LTRRFFLAFLQPVVHVVIKDLLVLQDLVVKRVLYQQLVQLAQLEQLVQLAQLEQQVQQVQWDQLVIKVHKVHKAP